MRSWRASASVRWWRSACSLYARVRCVYGVVSPCVGRRARSVSCAHGRARRVCVARTARPGGGGVGYVPAENDPRATEAEPRARPPRANSRSSSPRSQPVCARELPLPPPGALRWRASTREGALAWMIPTLPSSTSGRARRRAGAPYVEQKEQRVRPHPASAQHPSPSPADSATASALRSPTCSTRSAAPSTTRRRSRRLVASPPPARSCPRASSRPFPSLGLCLRSRSGPRPGSSTREG